jgi:hypothetical protein
MVNGDDRGQLLLLAALIVAATILGSIALLNSIHESPEIATQQDSRSLQETEWVTDQTGTNLERLFRYVTSVEDADIPLPYAEKPAFRNAVKDYDEQFLNLSTVSSSGLVTVSYNDSASRTGGIAHGNIRDASSAPGDPDPKEVLFPVDEIPRLHLNITNSPVAPDKYILVRFNRSSGAAAELNITSDGSTVTVEFEDPLDPLPPWSCDVGPPGQLQIDVRADTAIIQSDNKYCERGPVKVPDNTVIEIVDGTNSMSAEGNFTVTGVGSGTVDSQLTGSPGDDTWHEDDVLVDPVFDIVYESPEVSYEGEYTMYGDNR